MIENRLNKLIESIVALNSSAGELNKPGSDANAVILSFEELQLLADIFADTLPHEISSFADSISEDLTNYSNPVLTNAEKDKKENEIISLFESNKNSVVYLNSLNKILTASEPNYTFLEELNRAYDFPMPHEQIPALRDNYLEKVAELYALGKSSDSIQYLLRMNNDVFLEHHDFVTHLKGAVTITERERLKKKMQDLDDLDILDLPESEIKAPITLSERERLKGVMRKIDEEEENKERLLIEKSPVAQSEHSTDTAKVISFNWRRFAVAATIIGLIAISVAIIYVNRKTSSGIVRNNSDIPDTTKNKLNSDQNKNDVLVYNSWDTSEMALPVKKEEAMGFAAKEEKITVQVYRLKEKITGLPVSQIDSLRKLDKTFTFKNNTLSIYLTQDSLISVFKIDNKYYAEITGSFYYISSSYVPVNIRKVTDKNILARIDKIKFQQD